MRWLKGARAGSILLGGNGKGTQPKRFHWPMDLSFDRHNYPYVIDRVQTFPIDATST